MDFGSIQFHPTVILLKLTSFLCPFVLGVTAKRYYLQLGLKLPFTPANICKIASLQTKLPSFKACKHIYTVPWQFCSIFWPFNASFLLRRFGNSARQTPLDTID